MTTLANLINEFGANAFVFADAGNGSAFGEAGQAVDYDEAAAECYGRIELTPLPVPMLSNDKVEVNYASDWIDGGNGYRFRIMF